MNRRYRDNMLEILRLLETKRRLTVPGLVAQHPAGLSLRTMQRYIREFQSLGLNLAGKARGELCIEPKTYLHGLCKFIRIMLKDRVHPPVHGEISEKLIQEALIPHAYPARLIADLLYAIRESRQLQFHYKPQHPETRRKLEAARARSGQAMPGRGYMMVRMVPYGFSFGGDLMLLVGETRFSDRRIEHRQYALRGISHWKVGQPTNVQLTFNFSELYCDSLYTWLGGKIYHLTIEDSRFDETPSVYELRANGEEEPLAFANSALGRIKILNPPEALVKKAAELGITGSSIFRQVS